MQTQTIRSRVPRTTATERRKEYFSAREISDEATRTARHGKGIREEIEDRRDEKQKIYYSRVGEIVFLANFFRNQKQIIILRRVCAFRDSNRRRADQTFCTVI